MNIQHTIVMLIGDLETQSKVLEHCMHMESISNACIRNLAETGLNPLHPNKVVSATLSA
jgi:hypothetical protein